MTIKLAFPCNVESQNRVAFISEHGLGEEEYIRIKALYEEKIGKPIKIETLKKLLYKCPLHLAKCKKDKRTVYLTIFNEGYIT